MGRRLRLCAAVVVGANLFAHGLAFAQPSGVEPGVIEREFQAPPPPEAGVTTVLPAPLLPGAPPPGADQTGLLLREVTIEGATVFTASALQSYAAPLIGTQVTLAQVFGVAQKITKAYSDAGYPLSIAIVPAQEIKDGRVKILVIEGYVAIVEIAGDAGAAADALAAYGEKIKGVRPLTRTALERYLLLANDLPGLTVRAILDQAPQAQGGVKLILAVDHKPLDVSVGINNRGSVALGRERGVMQVAENGNLTGREVIELGAVQSFQAKELTYLYGHIETLLDKEGTTLALTGTWSNSEPGTPILEALNFDSNGWTAILELSHPFLRSRQHNLRVTAALELKSLESNFGAIPDSRDEIRILRGGILTDFVDRFSGVTQINALLSQGLDVFNATAKSDPNKSRADGSGVFTSLIFDLTRLQPLGHGFDLWLSGRGQIASRPLLASEECGYGGAQFGRGFDNYEIAGESCAMGLAELTYRLPWSNDRLGVRGYGFYDVGVVRQKGELLPGDKREETGQSVGGGVRFDVGRYMSGYVGYAVPLTRDVALEGDDDGRVFFNWTLSR
jgi:hemolysin activation/secretion protein